MKKPFVLVAVACAALAFHSVANPLLAATQLRKGIEAKDGAAIAKHIDFPALRADLMSDVDASLRKDTGPFSREVTKAVVAQVFDSVLNEDGIASWLTASDLMPEGLGGGKPTFKDADFDFDFGIREFVVRMKTDHGPLGVVMAPRGLSWKVVGIDFDLSLLGPDYSF